MNYAITEVVFKVEAALGFGEDIRLSGNVPALGNNDPARCIRLFSTKNDFPIWTTKSGNANSFLLYMDVNIWLNRNIFAW